MEVEVDVKELSDRDMYDKETDDTVCTICNAEFLDAEDLTVHLTQVHTSESTSIITCQFCPRSVADLESYACHIRDFHIQSLQLCKFCTKAFTESDDRLKHERKHSCLEKNLKKCSQCSALFDNTSQLEMHEYERHNNNRDGILLQDYSPVFSSVFNYKFMLFIKSLSQSMEYSCVSCKFESNILKDFIKHLREKECRAFTCNDCSQTFRRKRFLYKHLQTNSQCNVIKKLHKTWKCQHCLQEVNSLFFKDHVKSCKPIKCNVCNIVFKTLNSLSEHQLNVHPASIEIKMCKFCSRQCVGTKALTKHMTRVHAQEFHLYKYKCVDCGTVFKHPQKLFAHYFIAHKDLSPYTCKICNKKFRIRKKFTLHIKLDHKSVGFVEFDKNYHVFFCANKSEKPFTPTCAIPEEEVLRYTKIEDQNESMDSETDEKDDSKCKAKVVSDFHSESEGIRVGIKRKKKLKQRRTRRMSRKRQKRQYSGEVFLNSSDDDRPLVSLTKEKKKWTNPLFKLSGATKNNRKLLTCPKCDKYCYTFQNYQHHMTLHKKNERKPCIKCSKVFISKEKLNKHLEKDHASSKLTETLRTLLEKKKQGLPMELEECSKSEKFRRTIKKANMLNDNITATVKSIGNDTSLQKFIETFTPESNEISKEKTLDIQSSITVKMTNISNLKKPVINMTKFVAKPMSMSGRLALPVKFKQDRSEKVTISMRMVHTSEIVQPKFVPQDQVPVQEEFNDDHFSDHYEEEEEENIEEQPIPDVAEEVLLEGTEDISKPVQIPHKIVIPKMPQGCTEMSIAHLLPEAPFFKIVKVKDVISEEPPPEPEPVKQEKKDIIKLADGTKLVTVNPLAHLLGDKKLEQILEPIRSKYYKPKLGRDVENLFSRALEKANTYTHAKKGQVRKKVQKKGFL